MRSKSLAANYASIGNNQAAIEKKPEELILLLMEKACSCLLRASMLQVDRVDELELQERLETVADFHSNTGRCLQILVSLREILDMEAGGALARQLDQTYQLLAKSIWRAAKEKDRHTLTKMHEALSDLREGWAEIASA